MTHTDAQTEALPAAIAANAMARYGLSGAAAPQLINLSENATFRVDGPDGKSFALRVHREGYHTHAAIASELAWAMALRADGVATTPCPVKGLDGAYIQRVKHPRLQVFRHVVLFRWETGHEPQITDRLEPQFETLGALAARMHRHAKAWPKPQDFIRPVWNFETCLGERRPNWGRWRDGMGVDAAKIELFARAVARIGRTLAAYGQGPERFGLIHADLRLANLLVDDAEVKVLDFDDCGFGWHMYDAVTPVSFHEHEAQVPGLIAAWKAGYRSVLPLAAEDEAIIPTLLMLRRLLLVAWLGSHRATDLARQLGPAFSDTTAGLCEAYLMGTGLI